MDKMQGPHRSMAELARERNLHPVELMIDLALERDLKRFFLQPIANEDEAAAVVAPASKSFEHRKGVLCACQKRQK